MVVISSVILALAGLASVASAVPMGGARKSFTVNQLHKPAINPKTVNLPAMYEKALLKYGAAIPDDVKAAAERGSAVTTPVHHDLEYLTPVNVGGTTLNLNLDTGSADL